MFRGAGASIPRAFVGSTSQLTSFDYAKQYLNKYEYFQDKKLLTSFLGSMVGGAFISVAMTPFDLVLTRLYNQRKFTKYRHFYIKNKHINAYLILLLKAIDDRGKGKLYTSYMDCVTKIFKTEGLSAFYKGVGPQYLRLGPHTVLCLVFWDELKALQNKFINDN